MSLAGTYIICFSKLYRNIQLCFFFQVVYMAVNFLCLFWSLFLYHYRYKSCFKNKFLVHEFQIDKTRLHHNYVRKHLQKTGLRFIGNGHEGDKVFRTRADKIHVELIKIALPWIGVKTTTTKIWNCSFWVCFRHEDAYSITCSFDSGLR